MKSVLSNNCCEKKEKPFPKLMISNETGAIVIFSEPRVGTCVNSGSGISPLARYSETWCEASFHDYEGDVCLSND